MIDVSIEELFAAIPGNDYPAQRAALEGFLKRLDAKELKELKYRWRFWARKNQIAPEGLWTFWLLLAGRGFGKTRSGAEWINERVISGKGKFIHLIAPTAADVRKVMVEGESGLIAVSPPWNKPEFEPSKLKLTWPNGAVAFMFSAEEPERLRGPQCDTIWADELAAWKKLQDTWDMAMFGFRLGDDPRAAITTTPKPLQILKELLAREGKDVVVTRGSTYDNKQNLAQQFFVQVVSKYEGTRLGRQELDAEILEDMPGALWARTNLDGNRIHGAMPFPKVIREGETEVDNAKFESPVVLKRHAAQIMASVPEDLSRVVIAVDPNTSNKEGSDEIGITVQGKGTSGRGYVLYDGSMRGSPNEWGSVCVLLHDAFMADGVIGEANQGGNMVEYTVQSSAKFLKLEGLRSSDFINVTLVHATRGKVTRAEPVAALYEQNRIAHVGQHQVLEDQMCLFTLDFDRNAMGYSPDRVDALVWGFTHLFHEQQEGAGLFEYMKQEAAKLEAGRLATSSEAIGSIWMKAPPGVTTAFGRFGQRYEVQNGTIKAAEVDVPGFRVGGFVEIDISQPRS